MEHDEVLNALRERKRGVKMDCQQVFCDSALVSALATSCLESLTLSELEPDSLSRLVFPSTLQHLKISARGSRCLLFPFPELPLQLKTLLLCHCQLSKDWQLPPNLTHLELNAVRFNDE